MTQDQILREFEALPRQEQENVARTILRLVDFKKEDKDGNVRRAALNRLRGALHRPGSPPTDAQVNQIRDEHLMRKYQRSVFFCPNGAKDDSQGF